jgi:hypothetical protein
MQSLNHEQKLEKVVFSLQTITEELKQFRGEQLGTHDDISLLKREIVKIRSDQAKMKKEMRKGFKKADEKID